MFIAWLFSLYEIVDEYSLMLLLPEGMPLSLRANQSEEFIYLYMKVEFLKPESETNQVCGTNL